MKQLYIICEGHSEQSFCRITLQDHLFREGDGAVHAINMKGLGTWKSQYPTFKNTILQAVNSCSKKNVYFTTFIDLYAIPRSFPGLDDTRKISLGPKKYVEMLEIEFSKDIGNPRGFIPYIQLHEFETMLFAEPSAFGSAFENCDVAIAELQKIATSKTSIELINDGQHSAPSKRIIELIPEYRSRKSRAGPEIAAAIGLPTIRAKCPHFDAWLTKLESIPWEVE
jgi:hypothetical protein